MLGLRRRNKVPPLHSFIVYRGRVCEVVRVVRETGTLWCDVDDIDTGDRHSVPANVITC